MNKAPKLDTLSTVNNGPPHSYVKTVNDLEMRHGS